MKLVDFNALRRVDFGLLSILLLCSTTLEFVRVVRATSLPLGSALKKARNAQPQKSKKYSALKKARNAQPQKSKKWMKDYNKESNKTFNKTFYKYFHLFYYKLHY